MNFIPRSLFPLNLYHYYFADPTTRGDPRLVNYYYYFFIEKNQTVKQKK